jgi:hypothetical protein
MAAGKAKALFQLPATYTIQHSPDLLYSHALRLSPHWKLVNQRREVAGRELDPWLIREKYCMKHVLPSYQLHQKARRGKLIVIAGLATTLTLLAQMERILDWIEYEVYVK